MTTWQSRPPGEDGAAPMDLDSYAESAAEHSDPDGSGVLLPVAYARLPWREALRGEFDPARVRNAYFLAYLANTLADFGNVHGSQNCPSQATLAAAMCCDVRSVRRGLEWLRAEGWIYRHERRTRYRGDHYVLTVPRRVYARLGAETRAHLEQELGAEAAALFDEPDEPEFFEFE